MRKEELDRSFSAGYTAITHKSTAVQLRGLHRFWETPRVQLIHCDIWSLLRSLHSEFFPECLMPQRQVLNDAFLVLKSTLESVPLYVSLSKTSSWYWYMVEGTMHPWIQSKPKVFRRMPWHVQTWLENLRGKVHWFLMTEQQKLLTPSSSHRCSKSRPLGTMFPSKAFRRSLPYFLYTPCSAYPSVCSMELLSADVFTMFSLLLNLQFSC